jgi:F-type H+-transporting ATPase subunit epsilon
MTDTFQLQVATPERQLIDEQVRLAEIPGKNGYMGILAGHAPLLSALGAGVLSYEAEGTHVLAISGGFVEVFENQVRVLADHAEFPRDINMDQARRELQEANEELRHADSEASSNATLERIARAQARIDAADRDHEGYSAH